MANSVGQDQTALKEQSDLGLHCLPSSVEYLGNRRALKFSLLSLYSQTIEILVFFQNTKRSFHMKRWRCIIPSLTDGGPLFLLVLQMLVGMSYDRD